MNKITNYITCLFLLLVVAPVNSEFLVSLPDGRKALLKDNYTWEYIDNPDEIKGDAAKIILSVDRKEQRNNGCYFGLRLHNNAPYHIKHLVPRFSAINKNNVVFDTISREFSEMKPTEKQYKAIQFRGISCTDILALRVHGADRCAMGSLNKFSSEKGECLKRIGIKESELVDIFK